MEEKKENNYKKFIIIITLVSIIIVIFSLSVTFYTVMKSKQCLSNPLIYGSNNLEKVSGSEIICSCSFLNGKYKQIYFDSKSIREFNISTGLSNISKS
jgi:hypothetical protein